MSSAIVPAPIDFAAPAAPLAPAAPSLPLFSSFPIAAPLLAALTEKTFATATDVQAAVLDPSHANNDMLVSSRTGSGKTIAFGLAAAASLWLDDEARAEAKPLKAPQGGPRILVVAPTRELAQQVERELSWLYAKLRARVTCCVGGMDPMRERRALDAGAHVVVGTPGRLCDHLRRGSLNLKDLGTVILDEADEMLDMGFREDLETILNACPEGRRTLLFSATMPPPIVELAKRYQKNAHRIAATPLSEAHRDIEVILHPVSPHEREHAVVNVLRFHDAARALVFVSRRETVNHLHAALEERGFAAVALSGELTQAERTRALHAVRDGRARVLVCTDVAARGLDLPEVSLVVHGDVAQDSVSMMHRNGRTGRAGRKGTAVVLATPDTRRYAERHMQAMRAPVKWTALPSPEQIRALDDERLLARVAEQLKDAGDGDERAALRAALTERFSADELAAVVALLARGSQPSPEDVDDSLRLAELASRASERGPMRGPPPRRDDRGPPPRRDDRGPPPRRDDRGPPPRHDDRGPPPRREHRGPPRGDDDAPPMPRPFRGPPPSRDERGPASKGPPFKGPPFKGPPGKKPPFKGPASKGPPPKGPASKGPPPKSGGRAPPKRK